MRTVSTPITALPGRRALALAGVLALLAVMLPAGAAQADPSLPGGTFIDDDGNVHEPMIEALVAARVTGGCDTEGPRYCPRVVVRRGQLATFLSNALSLPPAPSANFTDTAGNIHADSIDRVAAAGIAVGLDGRFNPNAPVSRAAMATFLTNAFDLPPAPTSDLTDTAGSVHADSIDRVAAAGITSGFGDGTYRPNQAVTRDQMATFLTRALGLDPIPVPSRGTPIELFPGLSFVPPGGSAGWQAPEYFDDGEGAVMFYEGATLDTAISAVVVPGATVAEALVEFERTFIEDGIDYDPDDWYRKRVVPGADDAAWFMQITDDDPRQLIMTVVVESRGNLAMLGYFVSEDDAASSPTRADFERFLLGSIEIDPGRFQTNF